jgi:hypothetical protein
VAKTSVGIRALKKRFGVIEPLVVDRSTPTRRVVSLS